MSFLLTLAYLFFIGSTVGWCVELLFRRYISNANPERKWINPGFCVGPYLPLYGSGLCILYLFSALGDRVPLGFFGTIGLLIVMSVSMTIIEYVAGFIGLKFMHVRLWDYRNEKGNFQGLICPKFSAIWAICGIGYYFFVHPHILDALTWLSENLAFSFVIGFFFGVFTIDAAYSANLVAKITRFAIENDVIVRYEKLKSNIRHAEDELKNKTHFLFAFRSEHPLVLHLHNALEEMERRIKSK